MATEHDLIWVENRRTPKVKSKGEKYEPTEAEGRIVKRRAATAEEERTIARGDWVRVNEHGDKPSDSGYKRKKSKVRPQKNTNAGHADTFGTFLNTVISEFVSMQGGEDGYAGVTHAGIAMIAADTGRVLLAQRAYDETDEPDVAETWEFPGGGLGEGEHPWAGALREFGEEVGLPPEGEVVDGWRSDDGIYQGFVYVVPSEVDYGTGADPTEVQAVAWAGRDDLPDYTLRPEVETQIDWDMVFGAVSGNKESDMPDEMMDEPEYEPGAYDLDAPIPVHGVVAPEEMPSGDKRAFGAGAMTRRPMRLPFSDQKVAIGGHDGSVVVGSLDQMMRKDSLIHWQGALMPSAEADDLAGRMQFFGGRYGVSVDGDQGNMDEARTEETATLWFDKIRAAGLTAVAIPAFHEAYVAFGPHPDMPSNDTVTAAAYEAAYESGDLIGASTAFARGPGWVTDPKATNRIHDYWTKKGQPGYAKVGWGTDGDFTRAKKLIGAKIAEHSPDKMRFLNQIIAQWHFDALGYWPGDLGKPGNAPDTAENRRRAATHAAALDRENVASKVHNDLDREDITETSDTESVWEAVLVSSAVSGNRVRPPLDYFHQHPSMVEDPWAAESAALVVEEPDAFGFQRTWGYAAEWGVCHVGMDGRCVEPPRTGSDDYPDFHLGRTKVSTDMAGGAQSYIYTGVLTCGVGHRDSETILSESPEQAMFDNIKNAWASVRVGENERGMWFSGVVLPKVDDDLLVKIEASGQVSGEWLAGEMRACLTVNVPGFPQRRASASYDEQGNVLALAASAFGQRETDSPCGASQDKTDDPIGDLAVEVIARIQAQSKMAGIKMAAIREQFDPTESES